MTIRTAKIDDLEAIVEIYNQSVPSRTSTADLEPVNVEERIQWFSNHIPDKYPIFVAEREQQVIGWSSLSPYRPGRRALRFTAEVSYYIHQDFQGQGLGSALLDYTITQCPTLEIKHLFALLLEVNIPSIGLLEKFQFERWGLMPNVVDLDGQECGHLIYGRRIY